MSPRPHRLAALGGVLLWLAFLAATAHWAYRLDLGGSHPPTEPGEFYRWVGQVPPELVAMELVRVSVFLACIALIVSSASGLMVSVLHPGRVSSALLRLVPALIRGGIETAAGVGLTGVLIMGPIHVVGADPLPPATVVMERIDPPPSVDGPSPGPDRDHLATMTLLGEAPTNPSDREQVRRLRSEELAVASGDHARSEFWTVAPGDNLWDIAEATVGSDSTGTDPSAVLRYWHHLIEANRSRLIDPGNPDLILPGQSLILPPH